MQFNRDNEFIAGYLIQIANKLTDVAHQSREIFCSIYDRKKVETDKLKVSNTNGILIPT